MLRFGIWKKYFWAKAAARLVVVTCVGVDVQVNGLALKCWRLAELCMHSFADQWLVDRHVVEPHTGGCGGRQDAASFAKCGSDVGYIMVRAGGAHLAHLYARHRG